MKPVIIIILLVIIPLFTSAFMVNYSNEAFAEKSLVINPKSLIHIQDNVFLLIFEGCTGSESIMINEIGIVSDTETLLLVEYDEGNAIPPQECRLLRVQIQAEDSSSITIVVESLGISLSIDPEELEKDALSYGKSDVRMGFPTQIYIRTSDLSHSPEPLTHEQIQECENAHNDFVTLASGEFGARYLYHNFVGDCIMLFEDPIWETEGEDRYEILSQRLTEMKQSLKEQEKIKKGPHMSPRAQMKHDIDPGDVQCRQDFELVMKTSDGSAACIKSHSIEKLIQRGWASQF